MMKIEMNLWRLKKQNTSHKRSNIFFKSVLIALFVYIYIYFLFILHIFLKVIFLCRNMFCEMFYLLLLSSSVFVCHPYWCAYFQILSNTMDFYKWKLNLIWSSKWIICKRITKHTCPSVGVLLTCHIKICKYDNSMPK